MAKMKKFQLKLFLQHAETGHMITPELPITASDERTAETMLSRIVADYEIRGWVYTHVQILSVEDVNV